MFIRLAEELVKGSANKNYSPLDVFNFHPIQLAGFIEALWEKTRTPAATADLPAQGLGQSASVGTTLRKSLLYAQADTEVGARGAVLSGAVLEDLLQSMNPPVLGTPPDTLTLPRIWHHLAYAYAIENTRIYEVSQRVLHEALHGERLGSLSKDAQRWVRVTEELFYRDSFPSLISTVTSTVRPDMRAIRRNAYYRMFGLDLNHGTLDNRPYLYEKPDAANRDFVPTFESFLREIWKGYINVRNVMGPSTTDDSLIAELASRLGSMLRERRGGGNLSREEYVAVTTMSWFHLTVTLPNTPIIRDLKADADTPEDRLRKLGERVGVNIHSKARSFFRMAEPLSRLLLLVEAGVFDNPSNVKKLYDNTAPANVVQESLEIINQWSAATGRDLKAVPVTQTPR